MRKEDCRVGMAVVYGDMKGVVVKINPKNARVRTVAGDKRPGSLWSIPYGLLEPAIGISTEMMMRSFEQPDNQGIKTYFAHANRADDPVEAEEGTPQYFVMQAVCELWRRLDDEALAREADNAHTARWLRGRYSDMINRLFGVLGREVSKEAADNWESGRIRNEAV